MAVWSRQVNLCLSRSVNNWLWRGIERPEFFHQRNAKGLDADAV
jgi:hypothetical protein